MTAITGTVAFGPKDGSATEDMVTSHCIGDCMSLTLTIIDSGHA